MKEGDPVGWTIVVIAFASSLFFFIVFGLLDDASSLSLVAFVLAAVSLVLALAILARLTFFSEENRSKRRKSGRSRRHKSSSGGK